MAAKAPLWLYLPACHTLRWQLWGLFIMDPEHLKDVFVPYSKLVTIRILGKNVEVPENNSVLRCLQFLDMERVSEANLCWNGDCVNCRVWIKNGEKEKPLMSCRSTVEEGMEIVRLSDDLMNGSV